MDSLMAGSLDEGTPDTSSHPELVEELVDLIRERGLTPDPDHQHDDLQDPAGDVPHVVSACWICTSCILCRYF